MTTFPTCVGCSVDRDACHMLAAVKRAISGLYVTTVKHRCERRVPLYEPGAPVQVSTFAGWVAGRSEYDEQLRVFAWFPATFIRQIDTKGVAFVKPGTRSICGRYEFETEKRGFVKITLQRMKPADHAPKTDVAECGQCGIIPALEECQGDAEFIKCLHRDAPAKP